MKRFALVLAVFGMLALTVNTDAAPRRFGGGYGGGYGNGGYGYGNGGYGYGNGGYGYGNGGYYGNGYGYGNGGLGGLGIYSGSGYGYGNGYYGNRSYGNGYYGNGSYNNGYYGNGYTSGYGGFNSFPSNWYSVAPFTTRGGATVVGTQQPVVQATYTETTPMAHWGLRIDEVTANSAAQKADLRKGDIIVGVGKTRTETFEELQQALAVNNGTIEVTFQNAESQRLEKVRVTPNNGKIGVSVVPIPMP